MFEILANPVNRNRTELQLNGRELSAEEDLSLPVYDALTYLSADRKTGLGAKNAKVISPGVVN